MIHKNNNESRRVGRIQKAAAALCLGALGAVSSTAFAQADGYKLAYDFGAGVACDFPLLVEYRGGSSFSKEFRDKDGNLVRLMSAGNGSDFRLTNRDNGMKYLIPGRGSLSKTDLAGNGTSTTVISGHSVLILYPSDTPAGPSTTQYVGRVEFTTDAQGNYALGRTSGRSTDLCARLSSGD